MKCYCVKNNFKYNELHITKKNKYSGNPKKRQNTIGKPPKKHVALIYYMALSVGDQGFEEIRK